MRLLRFPGWETRGDAAGARAGRAARTRRRGEQARRSRGRPRARERGPLRDVPGSAADRLWTRGFGGKKDALFVYDTAGRLFDYLPFGGARATHLSKPEGYALVREVVKAAAKR